VPKADIERTQERPPADFTRALLAFAMQILAKNAKNRLKIPWEISRPGSSPGVRTN